MKKHEKHACAATEEREAASSFFERISLFSADWCSLLGNSKIFFADEGIVRAAAPRLVSNATPDDFLWAWEVKSAL